MSSYFLDTYALVEICRGNSNFDKYLDKPAFTTKFNVAELNVVLKRELPKLRADQYTEEAFNFVVGVKLNDIIKAGDLKRKHRISIPDAIGYAVSNRLKTKFVTGDSDFKNMRNVEFVK